MGKAPASEQVCYLDRRSILAQAWTKFMVLRRDGGSKAQRSRPAEVRLVNPTEIPIRRYVKVKSNANPFDLHWRRYFETRKRFR